MSKFSDYSKGLALTCFGGLVLTVDIPLIRLAQGEPWSILVVRAGCMIFAALVFYFILKAAGYDVPPLIPGRQGFFVGLSYGVSAVFFIGGVYYTTSANLVFMLAVNPMLAALLSWYFLNERPPWQTFVAMGVMFCAVLLIIDEGVDAGNWFGDILAFIAALTLAAAITLSRASKENMAFTPLIAAIIPLVTAGSVLLMRGDGFEIAAPGWIFFNGLVIIPIAFFCLAKGPQLIPGPQVAMFYLLETVLAPIWIWLIFNESPSRQSLIGGAMLIIALIGHSIWQLSNQKQKNQ